MAITSVRIPGWKQLAAGKGLGEGLVGKELQALSQLTERMSWPRDASAMCGQGIEVAAGYALNVHPIGS